MTHADDHQAYPRILPRPLPPPPSRPIQPPCSDRRLRALRTCHRPALDPRERKPVRDNGAYVPEMPARIDNDPNLSDGARRCARKIVEETYRRNRTGRCLSITVSYLANALGRCRRSIQRYLRQLQEGGYLEIAVIAGHRTRLSIGLFIRLCAPLFPRHHREKWPGNARKSGATPKSQNHRFKILIPRNEWALRCMDGVFRAYMKTNPLKGLPLPRLSPLQHPHFAP